MRIVFAAAGGPLGADSLDALAREHEIVAVLRPRPGSLWRRVASRAVSALRGRLSTPDPVTTWTTTAGAFVIPVRSGADATALAAVRTLAPDLLCVASFPWVLHADWLRVPRLGALNLHPSLLPRHRGANPLFWTYHRDDREAGVTVHRMSARVDAGPILTQQPFPLPRGWPVDQLYRAAAERGAELFREAVSSAGRGEVGRVQDDRGVTRAPRVPEGTSMVDFATWDVERVWHFLAGLFPRFIEPLEDERGRLVSYRGVAGFDREETARAPATVETIRDGWALWCRGGRVMLRSVSDRAAAP